MMACPTCYANRGYYATLTGGYPPLGGVTAGFSVVIPAASNYESGPD
jgi:hypothetical protein